jgi:hypothetical protein
VPALLISQFAELNGAMSARITRRTPKKTNPAPHPPVDIPAQFPQNLCNEVF